MQKNENENLIPPQIFQEKPMSPSEKLSVQLIPAAPPKYGWNKGWSA